MRATFRSAAKEVAEHTSAIGRLELELAALEVKKKVTSLAFGVGFGIGAAVVGVFMLGFGFATLAAVLATFLSTWLALLIVTGVLVALAGLLALLALVRIRKGTPPLPKQAIEEARLTTEALRR